MMSSMRTRMKDILREMFDAGINSVLPHQIILNRVKVTENRISIDNIPYDLTRNVYLVGFGKAVMGMAVVLEQMLVDQLQKGIVCIPRGAKDKNSCIFPSAPTGKVLYQECGFNNQPDKESFDTTRDIISLVESLSEEDTLITLVSGGGSALLYMPRPGITATEKQELCWTLQNSGADIKELNKVRQKLSLVKGGGLAKMAYPARVLSFVLSDIVGDPIDLVASGPTVYSPTPTSEVVGILKKYNLFDSLQPNIKSTLTKEEPAIPAGMLDEKKQFRHVTNIVIGNNELAMKAAEETAVRKGLYPVVLRNDITGDVGDLSSAYAQFARLVCEVMAGKGIRKQEIYTKLANDPVLELPETLIRKLYDSAERVNPEGLILIFGGEPTVTVKGDGKGGRNQELALHFSMDWLANVRRFPELSEYEVLFLSGGTDGQDGPTDAAGAFGYPAIGPVVQNLLESLKEKYNREFLEGSSKDQDGSKGSSIATKIEIVEKMIPEVVLRNNDSYNFYKRFKRGSDLVKTGLTGTNVMDLHFIYIRKTQCECASEFGKETEEHDLSTDVVEEEIDKTGITENIDERPENLTVVDETLLRSCCSNKSKGK